jgi:hypothetical protein
VLSLSIFEQPEILDQPKDMFVWWGYGLYCRRKVEMSPGAQSRHDTPWSADTPPAKRHPRAPLGESGGVKGYNRLAGARSAALEAVVLTQHRGKAVRPTMICIVQSRPYPRGGSIAASVSRSRSTIA